MGGVGWYECAIVDFAVRPTCMLQGITWRGSLQQVASTFTLGCCSSPCRRQSEASQIERFTFSLRDGQWAAIVNEQKRNALASSPDGMKARMQFLGFATEFL